MQILTAEIINRALKRRYPEIKCLSCVLFPKAEFIDGKWQQSQSYFIDLKIDILENINMTVGDVNVELGECLIFLEKMLFVDLVLKHDDCSPIMWGDITNEF